MPLCLPRLLSQPLVGDHKRPKKYTVLSLSTFKPIGCLQFRVRSEGTRHFEVVRDSKGEFEGPGKGREWPSSHGLSWYLDLKSNKNRLQQRCFNNNHKSVRICTCLQPFFSAHPLLSATASPYPFICSQSRHPCRRAIEGH